MGTLNSKQEAQEKLQILRKMPPEDYKAAVASLKNLVTAQGKLHISKWDLLLIFKLTSFQVKKVLELLGGRNEESSVNVHHLLFVMVLADPHAESLDLKLHQLLSALSFEIEPGQIHISDLEYIFEIGYLVVEMLTDIKLGSSPMETQFFTEVIKKGHESTDFQTVVGFLEKQGEVVRLAQMLSNHWEERKRADTFTESRTESHLQNLSNYSSHQAHSKYIRKSKPGQSPKSKLDQRQSMQEIGLAEQELSGQEKDKGSEPEGNHMVSGSGLVAGEKHAMTTIDVMYSFEGVKVTFNDDVIRNMNIKLKYLKLLSKQQLDAEEDSNYMSLFQSLQENEWRFLECYSVNQLQQLVDSTFLEQKLKENCYSIMENAKEIKQIMEEPSITHLNEESLNRQSFNKMTSSFQKASQRSGPEAQSMEENKDLSDHVKYKEIEIVNENKVNVMMQTVFKKVNQQKMVELKFQLNKAFYKVHHFMKGRGKKLITEAKKFKQSGQIGGLNFIMQEILEGDNKVGSDQIFDLVYECHTRLADSGSFKDTITKFQQLKYQKRVNRFWASFWEGVLEKCSWARELRCFQELQYFQDCEELASGYLQDVDHRGVSIIHNYNLQKQKILDYCYQMGKLRSFLFVLKNYKSGTKAGVLETLRERMRKLKEKMEEMDCKLVQFIYRQTQKKKTLKTYFGMVGQMALSKCINNGIDSSLSIEYMLIALQKFFIHESLFYLSHLEDYPAAYKKHLKNPSQKASSKQNNNNLRVGKEEENQTNDNSVEKLLQAIIKFQRIKQIDQELMLNEFGMEKSHSRAGRHSSTQGAAANHDRFKSVVIKFAEEEERMGGSSLLSSHTAVGLASSSKEHEMKQKKVVKSLSKQITMANARQSITISSQTSLMNLVQQLIEQEYTNCGVQTRITQLNSYMQGKVKDPTVFDAKDLGNGLHEIKHESMQAILGVEDIQEIFFDSEFGGKSLETEEKKKAHSLCEQFLKSLAHQKSTKFQKTFKEARLQVFEEYINQVKALNKTRFINNLDLLTLNYPFEMQLEVSYYSAYLLDWFVKEKTKESMWKDVTGKNIDEETINQNIGHSLSDHSLNSKDELQSPKTDLEPKENEEKHSINQAQKDLLQFTELYTYLKGIGKFKGKLKNKIFKRIYKMVDFEKQELEINKGIVAQFLESAQKLDTIKAVQNFAHEKAFAFQENQDILLQSQSLVQDFLFYIEKKKIRGCSSIITGSTQFLTILGEHLDEEGQKEEVKLLQQASKDLARMNDLIQSEVKNIKLNILFHNYKEKSELYLKNFLSILTFNKFIHLSKKFPQKPLAFFSYLESLSSQLDHQSKHLEKVRAFMKVNLIEDVEESHFHKIGAKCMNNLIQGREIDEGNAINVMNYEPTGGNYSFFLKRFATFSSQMNLMTNYLRDFAFLDERAGSIYFLSEQYFGFITVHKQALKIKRDRIRMQEQYDEGLKYLVNVFEVYKTPVDHYQHCFEKVCRYIRKEILRRIIEADEGGLRCQMNDALSKRGTALIKNQVNKLEQSFEKVMFEPVSRLSVDRIKSNFKRDLSERLSIFKEFIDAEESRRSVMSSHHQRDHVNIRLMQELASLLLIIRIFYMKQEQVELNDISDRACGSQMYQQSQQTDKLTLKFQ